MKSILIVLLTAMFPMFSFSQTKISKTYPVENGQKIELKFDYPKVIHISSWDKKEISVEATVNINDGDNNAAFTLNETRTDGKISISNKIDMNQVDDAYYIVVNGVKTRFKSKADMESYRNEKSGNYSYQQKDIQVTIEVKLPANMAADVVSTYGMIELENLSGPIKVEATYGGIDATLNESKIGNIKLTNHFGKIYSNLDLQPTAQKEENFYTSITAAPGKGPSYEINASYGNIYLRKAIK